MADAIDGGRTEVNVVADHARLVAEQRKWVSTLAPAIKSAHPLMAPNLPTPVYRGSLRFRADRDEWLVEGAIEVAWQPKSQLRYSTWADLPIPLANAIIFQGIDPEIAPADLAVVLPAPEPEPASDEPPTAAGQLIRLDVGTGQAFSYVLFQLANFMNYHGSWVRHGDQPDQGRIEISGEGWRVTIDRRVDFDETVAVLKRVGGYAVTHVARLEREDGSWFSRDQAREMLDGLYWFCSFVRASACGPLLLTAPFYDHGSAGDGGTGW
jgi:hypothetical protein